MKQITKKLWLATGREHNLMRYSIGTSIRDAHVYSDEEAKEILMKKGYSELKAERFIQAVKENPFKDWIEF